MSAGALAFMLVAWGLVLGLNIWAIRRLLRSGKDFPP